MGTVIISFADEAIAQATATALVTATPSAPDTEPIFASPSTLSSALASAGVSVSAVTAPPEALSPLSSLPGPPASPPAASTDGVVLIVLGVLACLLILLYLGSRFYV